MATEGGIHATEGSAMGAAEGWGLHVRVRVPLDAIDLDVDWRPERDRVAILGPSGSGKSTLLRALAGLEPSAEGRVGFGDEVWLDSDSGVNMPAWERRVGWVPQDALLFPHLSLRENLAYAGAGESEVERMAESLFLSAPAAVAGLSPQSWRGAAMIISGKAKLAGVIGWPVDHSRSPRVHGYWLDHYKIDGAYVPLAVAPDDLQAALRALPLLG